MSTDPTAPAPSAREELETAYGDVLDALELLEERASERLAAETKLSAAQGELGLAQSLEFGARTDAQAAADHLKQIMDRLFVVPAAGLT